MKIEIAPSILTADFSDIGQAVKKLEASGADSIHCDVMDGTFVKPITFGHHMVKCIKAITQLPLDCHLMIEHPQTQVEMFAKAGADVITVHWEACSKISADYLRKTLELIKSYGIKCGVSVNPDSDVSLIFDVFDIADRILIMSVFPGYGGQKFIPSAIEQIKKAREYALTIGKNDMDIEVDGGINLSNVAQVKNAGANVIVAGSTVFNADSMAEAIRLLRETV